MNKQSNKTAHVMKLLSAGAEGGLENPILNNEFKEEKILNRLGNKIEKENDVKQEKAEQKKTIQVNITAEIINENIGEAMRRFNCCDCDLCKAEVISNTLEGIETTYANVLEDNFKKINEIKDKHRSSIVALLIRNIIKLKTNPIHN